jgi:hypothetical protein
MPIRFKRDLDGHHCGDPNDGDDADDDDALRKDCDRNDGLIRAEKIRDTDGEGDQRALLKLRRLLQAKLVADADEAAAAAIAAAGDGDDDDDAPCPLNLITTGP